MVYSLLLVNMMMLFMCYSSVLVSYYYLSAHLFVRNVLSYLFHLIPCLSIQIYSNFDGNKTQKES